MGIGILWVLSAAIMLGFYALPSKYVKGFSPELLWGSFWFLSMFIIPIIASLALVNNLGSIYANISPFIFISILALSMLWGIGNLLWGISISKIGMALGFSLLIGISTLVGSLLPFLMGNIHQVFTPGGGIIIFGLLVILLGIVFNGKAGLLREKTNSNSSTQDQNNNMRTGILMCIIGGICAAGFNLAYYVGDQIGMIGEIAQEQYGNAPWIARLAVMLPSFIGSGLVTVSYYVYLLRQSKESDEGKNIPVQKNVLFIIIMALVYCASLIIYGLGAYKLGHMGTSVGFAIFQAGCIIIANLLGLFTGEWKNSGHNARRWMYSGLIIMSIGIVIVSIGNYLLL